MRLNGHRLETTDLGQLIRVRAALAEKPLAFVEEEELSYAEADLRSNRIANSLRALGVDRGEVVATYMENSIDHICIWFACAKLGAIWAPLNVSLVNLDLKAALANARPRALFVDDDLLPRLLATESPAADPDPIVVVRGEVPATEHRLRSLAELELGRPDDPGVALSPNDPAALVYTGGTTGLPKGVVVPHLWYFGGALRYRELFEPNEDDAHLGIGHLCHTLGSAVDVVGPMFHGMTTVLSRRFSASRFWNVVERRQAGFSVLVGPLLSLLLRQPARPEDAANPLRTVAAATGQMNRKVPDEFCERFGVELLEIYGQTETGPLGCVSQRSWDRPYHSAGRGHGWADFRIVDPAGSPCPVDLVGEILVRSTHPETTMLGYHRDPEATDSVMRDGWFHSGDLGHVDALGYLHFDGRRAHSIRRRGENIAVAEVEQAILLHPAVGDCAVVGVPSEIGEEEVKACVVVDTEAELSPEELIGFCSERIADFKVPRYVEFLRELPRSVVKSEVERHKLRTLEAGEVWDREASTLRSRRLSSPR
jgi:carnitine-CoA ligase